MDLVGHVSPEGVETEPPHAGIHRISPGHHDGHDVDVPDTRHAEWPSGHAVGIVVGETHRQVPAAVGRATPRALYEVAPGQVVDHVGARVRQPGVEPLRERWFRAFEREERFATAREMREALMRAAVPTPSLVQARRRSRTMWLAALGAIVAGAATTVLVAWALGALAR